MRAQKSRRPTRPMGGRRDCSKRFGFQYAIYSVNPTARIISKSFTLSGYPASTRATGRIKTPAALQRLVRPDPVCHRYLVAEAEERRQRPKGFFLCHFHLLRHAGHDCGFEEGAAKGMRVATAEHLATAI